MEEKYPIVIYAELIGKNTANFTAYDMGRFMDWWIGQSQKEEGMKEDIMVEIGLSPEDVKALVWGIEILLEEYDFMTNKEAEKIGMSLQGILNVLVGKGNRT